MKEITVAVQNKIAKQTNNVVYVCGNSDYAIKFTFDEEWNGLETKTARFIWNGQFEEVVFSGDTCPVPVISNTYSFEVGVYAGNLRTTTPAYVSAKKSILCGDNSPREAGTFLVPSDLLDKKADKAYVDELAKANGSTAYVQDEEPEDAKDGSLWVDTNENPPESESGGSDIYVQDEEPKNAPDGSLWVDTNEEPKAPSGGITQETDPTVPDWAKQPQKPTYTAEEVGAATQEDINKALAGLGGNSSTTSDMPLIYERTFEQVNLVSETIEDLKNYKRLVFEVKFFNISEKFQVYYMRMAGVPVAYGHQIPASATYPYGYIVGDMELFNSGAWIRTTLGNVANHPDSNAGMTGTSYVSRKDNVKYSDVFEVSLMKAELLVDIRLKIWGC